MLVGTGCVADDGDRSRRCAVCEQDLAGGVELPRPALRTWVVEREREVGGRRRSKAGFDRLPRCEEIGQADRGEVVPERCAHGGGGGEGRGHTRHRLDRDAGGVGRELEGDRGHGVHARVARAHERDLAPAGRFGKRLLGPHDLLTDRAAHDFVMRLQQVGASLDVGGVPDHDLRVADRRLGRRSAQRGRAGPEPDDAQPAGGTGTPGDRHRGDRVRLLGHDELGVRPGREERGGLGDAGRSDGVGDNCARGRNCDHAERLSCEPTKRQPERLEPRLARLPIECRDLGDRRARQPGAIERGGEEV